MIRGIDHLGLTPWGGQFELVTRDARFAGRRADAPR